MRGVESGRSAAYSTKLINNQAIKPPAAIASGMATLRAITTARRVAADISARSRPNKRTWFVVVAGLAGREFAGAGAAIVGETGFGAFGFA